MSWSHVATDGDGWDVDDLPDDDPRVAAHVADCAAYYSEIQRISRGDLTSEEINRWVVMVLLNIKARKWLNLERVGR